MSPDESGPLVDLPLAVALLEQGGGLLAVSDVHGALLWANRAFRQQFGSQALTGTRLQTIFATTSEPASLCNIAEALLDGEPVETVLAWRRADDRRQDSSPSWLRVRISKVGDHHVWTLTDISTERSLRARLNRLEELLDTAQEFGRLGVWERELSTGKGRWDDHVFRFWGIYPNQGTPSFEDAAKHIHPDDQSSREFVASTKQAGRYSQRFRVVQPDGSLRWLHSHWEIKASADGTPSHAVGIMVDDSETVSMARQLSEATAKLTIAVELGEIIIFEQNLNTDHMTLNARGCDILGLPFSEQGIPTGAFEELIHPDDREEMRATAVRALEERRPVDIQVRYRRSDGQWRHLLSRRVLQRDAKDRPLAFAGVALDVTERVHAQRALEETARGLEVATKAAGVGIWSRDTSTGEGQWNGQMFRLFDRDPQLGVPSREAWLSTMMHPADRALMASVQQRLAISPEGATTEYRVIRPDGSIRWMVELARREERNGRLMIFGATMDITDRKRADLALRQANERIALATRGAGIGTWERDLRTEAVRWDEQMFVLRGLAMPVQPDQQTRAASELHKTLIHPDDTEQIETDNLRSMNEATMASHEYRVRRPDGSYRWLASRSIPVPDDSGQVVRQIGVEWDVHDRVMADEVRREAQVAQRQSEAKAALLARMSHELRTPLNAILGFTELMARDQAPGVESKSPLGGGAIDRSARLAHIRHAAERLLELVDDVLDLSRIETGELKLQPDAIELLPLLQEITDLNAQKARTRAVRLRLNGEPVTVFADPTRLRQILSKLVAHHVGITPARSQLEVGVSRSGSEARISLAERGRPGTTALQLDFFGLSDTGLTAARPDPDADFGLFGALLNGMNGRIEWRREAADGERVVMWLPLSAAGQVDAQPPIEPRTGPGRRAQVLYIEDNPVNVILVEELCKQRGDIDFCSESHGNAGVGRALQLQADLILIDIHLPDIDGFEVLRRLRAQPQTAASCCVALSANAMPEDVARARAAGFDDYWTKPIRFASFLAGLNRLLPDRPQQPPAA